MGDYELSTFVLYTRENNNKTRSVFLISIDFIRKSWFQANSPKYTWRLDSATADDEEEQEAIGFLLIFVENISLM